MPNRLIPPALALPLCLTVGGCLGLAATYLISLQSLMAFGEALIRNTARLSLVWYGLAVWGMIGLSLDDWLARTPTGRWVRGCWTWGVITFGWHVLVAFHYEHHWSHAKAFAHVEEASRFGYGIYVSYFFTAIWMIDVGGWWLSPARYAHRSAWLGWALHLFMLFIVFNSTVVFESGTIRWLGGSLLAVLAAAWLRQFFHRGIHEDSAADLPPVDKA
jgi:hypothetical protein